MLLNRLVLTRPILTGATFVVLALVGSLLRY